jgi:hypothetical protein
MSSIPLDLQRRFEQRWAARFASAAPKSIALNRIVNSLPPRPAKAKGKPAGVNRRVREGGPEPAPVAVTAWALRRERQSAVAFATAFVWSVVSTYPFSLFGVVSGFTGPAWPRHLHFGRCYQPLDDNLGRSFGIKDLSWKVFAAEEIG